MKTIKSCAGFCFLIIAALFTLISCEFFIGSVPQYLKKYSEEIVVNNHHPQGPTQIDNTNTICFPSNYKEKFPYYVSYTNPRGKNADLIILDSEDNPIDWEENKITHERVDDYAYVIYFHNDLFLQPKDKETTDRKVSYTFSFIDGDVPVQTGKFKVTFNVNTPPDIIDGELGLCKAVVNNSIRNIVCFNLKPQSLENIYGDLKNSDGKYPITIDGKTYYFTFDSNGIPVFDDGNFYRSPDDISEASEFTVVNEFTQKQNPVYFVTNENLNKTYTISTKDNHGLVSPNYSISTKPSGNPQLVFTAQKINDYLRITPDFTARARKVGDTDIPLTKEILTLKYKINDEYEKTYDFTLAHSSPLNIYVPGGTSTVLCSMTCDSRDHIQNSDLVMETFNLPNAIYASPYDSDFNENYKGGNASHRIKIKDAVDYVNTQTGSWTIYLKAGTYEAQDEDRVTYGYDEYSYIFFKQKDAKTLNITLQGDSNSSRAVLNANGRARVIDNKSTSLTLRYVDITGGYIDTAGQDDNGVHGGGIKSTGALTLENCDIYENKTLGNKSSGGGIHCTNNITLKNTKIHNNQCKNHGGGIYIHTHEIILQGNNEIYENTANSHGGGINFYNTSYVELKSGVTSFTNEGKINGGLSVYKNKGSKGGGISFSEGAATISGVNVYDNENSGNNAEGVGIYSSGPLTLEYVYLDNNVDNTNKAEGAVYCESLTLQNKINLNTENIVIPPNSLTIIESGNNALKSDYISNINVKLKTDTDLATLLKKDYIELNGATPWWVSKINSADSAYVFSNFRSKNLELVNKKRMVYSTSDFSTVLTKVNNLDSPSGTVPGIIIFAEDYTIDANTSGDLITFKSQGSPKKYIVYGNGKVLNANRSSTFNGNAIVVNQNNDVEIRDFKEIRGGYTLKGGAIYIDKGTVTLKNTTIGKAPPRKSNNELDLSLNWSEEIYNKARNGGGIYVCNGGRLIVEPDTDENSYTYFCKNFATDGNGSALYVEKGGLAQLNRCYFIYNGFNPVNDTHGTIYCEKDAKLEIGNTNIQRNYCAGGTAGIYLAGDASIKINEGLTVKKNFIPTGVLTGDPATAEAAGIHTNESFFLSTIEYTEYAEGVNIPCIKNLELNNDMGLVDFNISQIKYKDGTTDRKLNCINSTKFFIRIFTYNGKAVSTARIGWKGNNGINYYYDLQKDAVINTDWVQGNQIQ